MKYFLKFILLGLCVVTISCNSNSDQQTGLKGTSDGGGGDIQLSTEQDIREALPKAVQILSLPNVFDRMLTLHGFDTNSLSDQQRKDFFNTISVLGLPTYMFNIKWNEYIMQSPLYGKDSDFFTDEDWKVWEEYQDVVAEKLAMVTEKYKYETLGEYIQMSQIYFLEQGSCPATDKKNAFASVSKFDIGADICFSLENLKTIPKHDLLKQMTALLAHEVAHLFGASETTAVKIQELTLLGFSNLVNSSVSHVPIKMYSLLIMAQASLQNISFEGYKNLTEEEKLQLEKATPELKSIVLQQIQGRKILLQLSSMFGYLNAFKIMFEEEDIPFPVFFSQDTAQKEEMLLEEIDVLRNFLMASAQLSYEELASKHFIDSLEEQKLKMDEIQKAYVQIMNFYR